VGIGLRAVVGGAVLSLGALVVSPTVAGSSPPPPSYVRVPAQGGVETPVPGTLVERLGTGRYAVTTDASVELVAWEEPAAAQVVPAGGHRIELRFVENGDPVDRGFTLALR
jgi:hypothetical protein